MINTEVKRYMIIAIQFNNNPSVNLYTLSHMANISSKFFSTGECVVSALLMAKLYITNQDSGKKTSPH